MLSLLQAVPSRPTIGSMAELQGGPPLLCNGTAIPTLVINMRSEKDRLHNFTAAQPDFLRAQTCRIDGINGSALNVTLPETLIQPTDWQAAIARTEFGTWTSGDYLTKGAVGLAVSHARAWQHVVQTRAPIAMVAEDDLRFYTADFREQLERACEATAAGGHDMVQLQSRVPARSGPAHASPLRFAPARPRLAIAAWYPVPSAR